MGEVETKKPIGKKSYSRLLLVLFGLGGKAARSPGLLLDLSLQGGKLVSNHPLQEQSLIHIDMEIEEGKPLPVKCKVLWSRRLGPDETTDFPVHNYLSGIEFVNAPAEASRAIVKYLCSNLFAEIDEAETPTTNGLVHRQFLRADVSLSLVCKDSRQTPFSLLTKNMSVGGLYFTTEHKLAENEKIVMELQLDLELPPRVIKGKIVWLRKLDDGSYDGGLQFVDVGAEARKAIVSYVAKSLERSMGSV